MCGVIISSTSAFPDSVPWEEHGSLQCCGYPDLWPPAASLVSQLPWKWHARRHGTLLPKTSCFLLVIFAFVFFGLPARLY